MSDIEWRRIEIEIEVTPEMIKGMVPGAVLKAKLHAGETQWEWEILTGRPAEEHARLVG